MKELLAAVLMASVLPSCSAPLANQKMHRFIAMQDRKMEAWREGLTESRLYCLQALTPPECRIRLIKLTASIQRADEDWIPLRIPPYLTVIETYERHLLRKVGTFLPIDRRFADELKITASLTDQGVLTQEQLKTLVVSALRNLGDNLRNEYLSLQYDYQIALASDAQIASAVALGVAAGLVTAAAVATTPRTPPAYTSTSRTFTVMAGGRTYICTSTPTLLTCF